MATFSDGLGLFPLPLWCNSTGSEVTFYSSEEKPFTCWQLIRSQSPNLNSHLLRRRLEKCLEKWETFFHVCLKILRLYWVFIRLVGKWNRFIHHPKLRTHITPHKAQEHWGRGGRKNVDLCSCCLCLWHRLLLQLSSICFALLQCYWHQSPKILQGFNNNNNDNNNNNNNALPIE